MDNKADERRMAVVAARATTTHEAYLLYGKSDPPSPIVHAVPHAGRDYPQALLDNANVSVATLTRLEDRYADLLTHKLIGKGARVLIARRPRAMIDLNRGEREFEPRMIADLPRHAQPLPSAKVRAGLGLIPESLAYAGALWRRRLPHTALVERIEAIHRPYHRALKETLAAARMRHGVALLLDIHSMPPLPVTPDRPHPPRIVIGDRFGRSAAGRLTALCGDVGRAHGLEPAINAPYAGNHILDRHGKPDGGIHAIQIEIDRSLYLDERLDQPGEGLPAMQRFIATLSRMLAEELTGTRWAMAAE